jgi:signal transduction histidine kinase
MHTEEEHKRLLNKIAFLEDELNAARGSMQNLQSIILSNISHDVRTPMNAIVGFANLLTDEYMDSNDRNECIDQINLNSSNFWR